MCGRRGGCHAGSLISHTRPRACTRACAARKQRCACEWRGACASAAAAANAERCRACASGGYHDAAGATCAGGRHGQVPPPVLPDCQGVQHSAERFGSRQSLTAEPRQQSAPHLRQLRMPQSHWRLPWQRPPQASLATIFQPATMRGPLLAHSIRHGIMRQLTLPNAPAPTPLEDAAGVIGSAWQVPPATPTGSWGAQPSLRGGGNTRVVGMLKHIRQTEDAHARPTRSRLCFEWHAGNCIHAMERHSVDGAHPHPAGTCAAGSGSCKGLVAA